MAYGLNTDNNPIRGNFILQYTIFKAHTASSIVTSINQDFKLRITIADYSKRCWLSRIIHRIIQFIRYIVTFGNTQWNTTKKEFTPIIKKNIENGFAKHLTDLFINKNPYLGSFDWRDNAFSEKLQAELSTVANAKKMDAIKQRSQELAREITKQINVSYYVNQFMNDLLKINTAPKKVFANETLLKSFVRKLNFASLVVDKDFKFKNDIRLDLADIIIQKEVKNLSKKLVAYVESNKIEQNKLLKDQHTFDHLFIIKEALFPQKI